MIVDLPHHLAEIGAGPVSGAWKSDVDIGSDPARSVRHDDDLVAQEDSFLNRMRNEEDRRSLRLPYPDEFRLHHLARLGIKSSKRLVHQQDIR